MFKFSGRLTQSEYWARILPNFVLWVVCLLLAKAFQNMAMHDAGYYGGTNSGELIIALALWALQLAVYINGMGITARRLRDAGKTSGQITTYYVLIIIPLVAFFALIVYFFIAGLSPSRASAEEQQAEANAQAARRAQAERDYQRKYEEQERQNRAKAWAEAEQSAAYQAQTAEPSAADREQAAAWAKEEAEKEQKLLAKQQATLRLPKN